MLAFFWKSNECCDILVLMLDALQNLHMQCDRWHPIDLLHIRSTGLRAP